MLSLFCYSIMSASLPPHGLQCARIPGLSLSHRVCSNSCPLSWWYHPTISSSVVPFSSCLQIFPSIGVFSNESALHMGCPKYWSFSFSISPSNEYSGLISFRIHWFGLLEVHVKFMYCWSLDWRIFENYLVSMWNKHNCTVVWTLFYIGFLWDWNENWPFPVLWSLLRFPNLLTYWVWYCNSIIF